MHKHKLCLVIQVCIFLISNTVSAQRFGNFPYEETFLRGKPGNISFPSSQLGMKNRARFINNGLQLTPDSLSCFGAVFINDRQFTSVNGIKVEFEYMVYGDTNVGGDGLCMFLFDNNVANPTIGAHGAGIGYAYNRAPFVNSGKRMTGLEGAYLGVALDEFGNYKGLRLQGESRVGGIPYGGTFQGSVYGMIDKEYNTRDQITLRGAKGVDLGLNGLSDGFTGYPVLITQSTTSKFGVEIDHDHSAKDGRYKLTSDYAGNYFRISGGGYFIDDTSLAYRKAFIELFPSYNSNNVIDGFLITVKIQHGKVLDTLIYDYHYKTSFTYQENAYPSGSGGDNNNSDMIRLDPIRRILDASIPDVFRIGFAASTGEERNFHIIKNLKITLPRAAEANNDMAETDQGVSVTIDALANDIAYDGEIKREQVGKREYLVESTFEFKDSQGNKQGHSYAAPEGTWTYNSNTGGVTFTPKPAFTGYAKVFYDIKGGKYTSDPYDDEAYRSALATITVTVKENTNPSRNLISNKMVTIKLEK